jgi:[acyl-carrier-protein] S-malonyltransferase
VARGNDVLEPANYNSPGQIVISGSIDAVRRAIELAPEYGARRAVELNVSGAFHSPLMGPAAEALEAALGEIQVRPARIPVVANVDGRPVTEPVEIRRRLLAQLTAPVRWVECVIALRDLGADTFVEPGAGNVLTALLKRIDRSVAGRAVGEPVDVEATVAEMAAA